MCCETIGNRSIYPPEVITPPNATACAVGHGIEQLLVPAERGKKLGREFIFHLKIVCECIRVADARNFETRFVKFRPQLQMMPGEADILAEDELSIIADIAATRQCVFSFGSEVRAVACRQTKVPDLIRPEAKVRIEGRMIETNCGDI